MSRTYKIRSFQNGTNKKGEPFLNHSLTIPSQIARALSVELEFTCELTEDGVLYRPVTKPATEQLPSWAQ